MTTTRGRKNLKPFRHLAPRTWIQNVDDDHSYALRSTCKYHQYIAVRDFQIYSDATIIERAGDDVIIETPGFNSGMGWQAPKRWRVKVSGKRELIRD